MKCPFCIKENKKSFLQNLSGFTTLMCDDSFYDEDGKYHYHDPNKRSNKYSCSNGHQFVLGEYKECWCGFNKERNLKQEAELIK